MNIKPIRPVPYRIVEAFVVEALNITPEDFRGKGRHPRAVLARGMVVYLARAITSLSFPQIAVAMIRPNHSSVIASHSRLQRILRDPQSSAENARLIVEQLPEVEGLTLGEIVRRFRAEILAHDEAASPFGLRKQRLSAVA